MTHLKYPTIVLCLLIAGLSVSLASSLRKPASAERPARNLTNAAKQFLKTLNAKQLKSVVFKYDAPERVQWHFIPKNDRKGLQLKEMNKQQREAADRLLRVCLSKAGYQKARTIMELEGLLAAIEKGRGAIRDPQRYYFTVFGEVNNDRRWGLSIEGHHLSLNFVIDHDELVSVSPSFFASNPGTVKTGIHPQVPKGTRILAAEEKLAFRLVKSLNDDQQGEAVIAEKAPKEIRAAGQPQPPSEKATGIRGKSLSREQLALLKKLVAAYTANFPGKIGQEKLDAIEKNGWDQVYFAWAGPFKPGIGHYYRIQGDSFLIEFVNTQPDAEGNPANHIHCVWRNPKGDFAIEIKK